MGTFEKLEHVGTALEAIRARDIDKLLDAFYQFPEGLDAGYDNSALLVAAVRCDFLPGIYACIARGADVNAGAGAASLAALESGHITGGSRNFSGLKHLVSVFSADPNGAGGELAYQVVKRGTAEILRSLMPRLDIARVGGVKRLSEMMLVALQERSNRTATVMVHLLVEGGARFMPEAMGSYAYRACRKGLIGLVGDFLRSGMNPNLPPNTTKLLMGEPPTQSKCLLSAAMQCGSKAKRVAITEMLIDSGSFDIDAEARKMAAKCGDKILVQRLDMISAAGMKPPADTLSNVSDKHTAGLLGRPAKKTGGRKSDQEVEADLIAEVERYRQQRPDDEELEKTTYK